jgi:hypothetical protein
MRQRRRYSITWSASNCIEDGTGLGGRRVHRDDDIHIESNELRSER